MKTLQFFGTFDEILLINQLLTAFPQWITRDGVSVTCRLGSVYDGQTLTLIVPDDADELAVQTVAEAHDPLYAQPAELAEVKAARAALRQLPNWATWTAGEATTAITQDILSGMDKAAVEAWVDANVGTLAQAKTALKFIGGELVDLREICARLAQAVIYLRDIAVRKV
jgi:hypothetical protein